MDVGLRTNRTNDADVWKGLYLQTSEIRAAAQRRALFVFEQIFRFRTGYDRWAWA
jgi:hypothetical protein